MINSNVPIVKKTMMSTITSKNALVISVSAIIHAIKKKIPAIPTPIVATRRFRARFTSSMIDAMPFDDLKEARSKK